VSPTVRGWDAMMFWVSVLRVVVIAVPAEVRSVIEVVGRALMEVLNVVKDAMIFVIAVETIVRSRVWREIVSRGEEAVNVVRERRVRACMFVNCMVMNVLVFQ